jgi:polyferredoxin
MDRPKGLIRLDSIEGIEKGKHKFLNARTIAYSAVLFILIGVEIVLFSLRSDVEVLFLRTGGLLSQEQADGSISNLYNYQMINKTADSLTVEFKMLEPETGAFEIIGGEKPAVGKNSKSEGAVFIKIPKEKLEGGKNKIVIGVYAEGKLITKVKTTFFGPIQIILNLISLSIVYMP